MGNDSLFNALSGFKDLYGNSGSADEDKVVSLDMNLISSFKDHPFKVLDDERMDELAESIREYGVLTPVLVRKVPNGTYEMISGHRRLRAATIAGLTKIPAKVREMDDDEAIIVLVDSNIQREEILPSEKAFAYKMKIEAMRHQGRRSDLFDYKGNGYEYNGSKKAETNRTIQRYIRLTELISPILDRIDRKEIPIKTGVEISFLPQVLQEWVSDYLDDGNILKKENVIQLKSDPDLEHLEKETVFAILDGTCPKETEKQFDASARMDEVDEIQGFHEMEPVEDDYEGMERIVEPDNTELSAEPATPPAIQEQIEPVGSSNGLESSETVVQTVQKTTRVRQVSLDAEKLDKYFPPTFSNEDIVNIIVSLLEAWKKTISKN